MRSFLPFWVRQHQFTAVALLVAATAAALVIPSFTQHKPVSPPAAAVIPMVMVAAHPIPSGAVLALQDIVSRPAAGTVPAEAYQSSGPIVGRVAARSFAAGDVLLASDLRDAASLGIASKLANGQRAFSIRIVEDEIVGGFLRSGDHVDVLTVIPGTVFPARNAGDVPDRSTSVLLLQNILVLAVGENLTGSGNVQSNARTITLALESVQAARLALAQRFGKVALAIRHPGDDTNTETPAVSLNDIVPPAVSDPRQQPKRVQVPAGIPFYAGSRVTRAGWSKP
jgi:pilus assembly protein CpaB